jgi:DNA-binding phage protein
MNIQKLRGKIVERGMNVETLAKEIGVDRSSMYRKLNNCNLTVGEVSKIKEALNLSNEEAIDIFFN